MHYHTLGLNSVTEPRYGYLPLKSIPKRERSKCWQKGKLLVIRMLALCGNGELSVTQKAFSKTLLGHEDFLREKWIRQRVRVCHLPRCVQACQFIVIFHQILFCSHSLFVRSLKEKLGKRSGHQLMAYSSFLVFWSIERTKRLGKVLCDRKT